MRSQQELLLLLLLGCSLALAQYEYQAPTQAKEEDQLKASAYNRFGHVMDLLGPDHPLAEGRARPVNRNQCTTKANCSK